MWRNYLTVGFRALAKNKTYAFINIFGLALGLAACLMILLYVRYETSYDEWLPDSARIYQVQATWSEPGQPVSANQTSPLPVRDTIAGGFPQIEAVTIAEPVRAAVIDDNQPVYVDSLFVDPAFFDIFQLPFISGSADEPLPNVASVVLTETEAMRQPVILANLIAWPIAWWAMRDWLNTFDVRIDLGPGPFAFAGLLALAIAVGTVAGHAVRVARTNPIHALRYE